MTFSVAKTNQKHYCGPLRHFCFADLKFWPFLPGTSIFNAEWGFVTFAVASVTGPDPSSLLHFRDLAKLCESLYNWIHKETVYLSGKSVMFRAGSGGLFNKCPRVWRFPLHSARKIDSYKKMSFQSTAEDQLTARADWMSKRLCFHVLLCRLKLS